jgi:hypothetical protein
VGYTREPASGSTHFRGTKIVATATAGTTIHTAQASTTLTDILTVLLYNSHTAPVRVTAEWGGTTAPDDNIAIDLAPGEFKPFVIDHGLRNSLVLKMFATVANVVTAFTDVNVEA